MKRSMNVNSKTLLVFLLAVLVMNSCSDRFPSVPVTDTPSPTATIQAPSTPTASPTFTALPPTLLAPLPRDIFDNFQQVAGYCKLRTTFGEILPGQTIEEDVLSDSTVGQIWFSLSWRGGDIGLTLLQPDGTIVDPSFTTTDPTNMEFTAESERQEYFIRGVQPGTWKARIAAKIDSPTSSAYMLEVWASDATIVSIDFDKDQYFPGDQMKISASIEDSISDSPMSPEYIYGVVMQVIAQDPELNRYSFELYDDGLHGDGKSNDGVYANTFADTSFTGNYKFFFHLSGHNNRAGEPFRRECFLGATVRPIPTPTPAASADSMACGGKIEASEPVVVREANVGGNDSSTYSRFAFYPKAISTSAGILVMWHMGFDGEALQPNVYSNLLDDNGHPVGNVATLFERNLIGESAELVRVNNGAVLTFCGHFKDDGRLTSAFLDPYGRFLSEQRREPADRYCSYYGAEAVWTGSRLMFAWSDLASSPVSTNEVLLDVADASGNSLFWRQLHPDSVGNPHIAVGHGLVLMAVPVRADRDPTATPRGQSDLAVYRFDLEGKELGVPVILEPVPFDLEGKTFLGEFGTTFVVPTTDGWLLLASSTISGYYVARFAPDGTLVSSPELMEIDRDFHTGFDDVLPYSNGAVILSREGILFLSNDGIIRQEWHQPVGMGSLIEHKGRLFVTYVSQGQVGPNTNEVLIRELQCAP